MVKHLLSIFVLALFFASAAHALNLGTIVKNDFSGISPGEVARFSILFWTADSEQQHVNLHEEAPEGWTVLIGPDSFYIDKNSGKEYIFVGGQRIAATPVGIAVIPNSNEGKYNIIIRAVSGNPGAQVSFQQERIFNLTVQIGKYENKSTSVDEIIGDVNEAPEPAKQDHSVFIFAAIFLIMTISILIYKRL